MKTNVGRVSNKYAHLPNSECAKYFASINMHLEDMNGISFNKFYRRNQYSVMKELQVL